MILRLLLVGSVATLGLDTATIRWLEDAARSGQIALWRTLDEWNTWPAVCEEMCEVETPLRETASAAPVNDASFGAAIEEFVAQVEAENTAAAAHEPRLTVAGPCKAGTCALVTIARPETQEVGSVQVAAESCAPPISQPVAQALPVYDGAEFALALNRENEGLGITDATPTESDLPDEGALAAEAEVESEPVIAARPVAPGIVEVNDEMEPEPPVVMPSGVRRLATALRLTGEALEAWARVLEAPAVVSLRP
jgi:hypothetical protein